MKTMRLKVSLRFQMTQNEFLRGDQLTLILAACVAIGSIDRMLKAGALVVDGIAEHWLRSQLPKQYGGFLTGLAAREARDRIRKWGHSVGGEEWKQDLATRVARGPIHRELDGSNDENAA